MTIYCVTKKTKDTIKIQIHHVALAVPNCYTDTRILVMVKCGDVDVATGGYG